MFPHLDLVDFFKRALEKHPSGVLPEVMAEQAIKLLPYALPKQIAAARSRSEGFIEVDSFWDIVRFENPGQGKILPGNPFSIRLDEDSYVSDPLCQIIGWSKDTLTNQLDVTDRELEADVLLQPNLKAAIEIARSVCAGTGYRICVADIKPSPALLSSVAASFRRTIRIYFAQKAS